MIHIAYGQSVKPVRPVIKSLSDFHNVRDFTMTSNGQEAYITAQSPLAEVSVILQIKKANNNWNEPTIASFSGKYKDLEASLSPNNLRLYFVSNRPLIESDNQAKDFDIWYVERKDINAQWGSPINIGSPINTGFDEFYPSVAKNNNLYFTSNKTNLKSEDDIYYSIWNNGAYSTPINLGDSINTNGYEFNAYIAPDETYILFSGYNRKDGFGSGDLYISFKDDNQNWSKAINLGKDINSEYMDYCPFIDTKTKTLYFTSKRSSFEKSNNFLSINDLISEFQKDENGLSRIYKVAFDKVITQTKKNPASQKGRWVKNNKN